MKHASRASLDRLAPLLDQLRAVSGLVERRPGTFYRRSAAFLHFHEDPAGLFADVKLNLLDFERFAVNTPAEWSALVRAVRNTLSGTAPPVVRLLGPSDVAALRAVLTMFGEAFDDRDSYCTKQPDDAYLRRLLSSDTFVAIAALDERVAVGGLAGYVLPKFEQPRSELYIYDLAVAADRRRRGIATAMIEKLRGVARERNIYVIFVQADHGDAAAIALYTKLGLREDVLHFDIAPSGGHG
jgi:aminoglycoside 3-N-acetyltransferase I